MLQEILDTRIMVKKYNVHNNSCLFISLLIVYSLGKKFDESTKK